MALVFRCPVDPEFKQRHEQLLYEHVESPSCYGGYKELCVYLQKYCKTSDRILTASCSSDSSTTGSRTGSLIEDLYDAGYNSLVGVDSSESNICSSRERNKEKRPEIHYVMGNGFKVRTTEISEICGPYWAIPFNIRTPPSEGFWSLPPQK